MNRKRGNNGDDEGIELVKLNSRARQLEAEVKAAQTYLPDDTRTEPEVYCGWCEANNGNLSKKQSKSDSKSKSKSSSNSSSNSSNNNNSNRSSRSSGDSSSNNNRHQARFYGSMGCKQSFKGKRIRNNNIAGNSEISWKTIGCPCCCTCEVCKGRVTSTALLLQAARGPTSGGEVGDE